MKKLLLLLFIPFVCLSQNDFRKMNWGESPEILKEKYSEINFVKEDVMGSTAFTHEDIIGGTKANVIYLFVDDKFYAGTYMFSYGSYSSKSQTDRLKDFNLISEKLEKYDMTREDVWINDTYKNRPNSLGHALYMEHVSLFEKGIDGDTVIVHSLQRSEGEFVHQLAYTNPVLLQKVLDSVDDDF